MNRDDITLAGRLRALRESRSWTQEGAAEECDVSCGCYQKYESGESLPNFKSLVKICRAYQVSPSYFITWRKKDEASEEDSPSG